MEQKLRAVFRSGGFYPREQFDAPDGTEFELIVAGPVIVPPQITDPEERKRILHAVVESMRQNPIPVGAKKFTRDELHERR